MDSIKSYLMEYIIKTGGPSAIRNVVQCVVAYLIVHGNALASWGIVTAAHVTTIDWSLAGVKLIALLPAIAAAIKIGQQHATEIVTTAVTPPKGNS